jgi:hypothetical protein
MIKENLLLVIFLIILLLFYFLNNFLKKNIENYGIYCGRYNIITNNNIAKTKCTSDLECIWNNYIARDGTSSGWCGQNS